MITISDDTSVTSLIPRTGGSRTTGLLEIPFLYGDSPLSTGLRRVSDQ